MTHNVTIKADLDASQIQNKLDQVNRMQSGGQLGNGTGTLSQLANVLTNLNNTLQRMLSMFMQAGSGSGNNGFFVPFRANYAQQSIKAGQTAVNPGFRELQLSDMRRARQRLIAGTATESDYTSYRIGVNTANAAIGVIRSGYSDGYGGNIDSILGPASKALVDYNRRYAETLTRQLQAEAEISHRPSIRQRFENWRNNSYMGGLIFGGTPTSEGMQYQKQLKFGAIAGFLGTQGERALRIREAAGADNGVFGSLVDFGKEGAQAGLIAKAMGMSTSMAMAAGAVTGLADAAMKAATGLVNMSKDMQKTTALHYTGTEVYLLKQFEKSLEGKSPEELQTMLAKEEAKLEKAGNQRDKLSLQLGNVNEPGLLNQYLKQESIKNSIGATTNQMTSYSGRITVLSGKLSSNTYSSEDVANAIHEQWYTQLLKDEETRGQLLQQRELLLTQLEAQFTQQGVNILDQMGMAGKYMTRMAASSVSQERFSPVTQRLDKMQTSLDHLASIDKQIDSIGRLQ